MTHPPSLGRVDKKVSVVVKQQSHEPFSEHVIFRLCTKLSSFLLILEQIVRKTESDNVVQPRTSYGDSSDRCRPS